MHKFVPEAKRGRRRTVVACVLSVYVEGYGKRSGREGFLSGKLFFVVCLLRLRSSTAMTATATRIIAVAIAYVPYWSRKLFADALVVSGRVIV